MRVEEGERLESDLHRGGVTRRMIAEHDPCVVISISQQTFQTTVYEEGTRRYTSAHRFPLTPDCSSPPPSWRSASPALAARSSLQHFC